GANLVLLPWKHEPVLRFEVRRLGIEFVDEGVEGLAVGLDEPVPSGAGVYNVIDNRVGILRIIDHMDLLHQREGGGEGGLDGVCRRDAASWYTVQRKQLHAQPVLSAITDQARSDNFGPILDLTLGQHTSVHFQSPLAV